VFNQMLFNITPSFACVFTKVAFEWLAVEVSITNVSTKGCWRMPSHFTEGAFVTVQMGTRVLPQQSLSWVIPQAL
jgi:hypothetical protein